MIRSRRTVLIAVGTTFIAGCSNRDRDRNNEEKETVIRPNWDVDLRSLYVTTPPCVLGDAVFVGTNLGLQSIPIDNPEERSNPFEDITDNAKSINVIAAPAVDETAERLIVPTLLDNTGTLFSITPGTKVNWRSELPEGGQFAPTVTESDVVVQTTNEVIRLSRKSGTIKWTTSVPAAGSIGDDRFADLSPTVIDDRVLVPCEDGLRCLDRLDGTERWHTFENPIPASPAVDETTVYVPIADDGIRAVEANSGQEKWKTEAFRCWTTPAVGDDGVYVATESDVRAFSPETGDLQWRFDDPGFRGSSYTDPRLLDNRIVSGSTGYAVVVVDREGSLIARSTGKNTRFSHAIADTQIVAAERAAMSRYELP